MLGAFTELPDACAFTRRRPWRQRQPPQQQACVCGVLGVFTELPGDELGLCLWRCAFTELPAAVMVCLVLSPSCLLLVLSPAAAQGLKSRKKAPENVSS